MQRESCSADIPLAALVSSAIAPRRSTKASLREAKIVPLVRLNKQVLHFYFRRLEGHRLPARRSRQSLR